MREEATAAASWSYGFTIAFALTVGACGPSKSNGRTSDESTSAGTEHGSTSAGASTTSDSTTSGTAAETSSGTTSGDPVGFDLPPGCECLSDFGCECYEDFSACHGVDPPCEAPTPCPTVGETNQDATICVLELMRDRSFARFSYCHECGGMYAIEGYFYVLGPEYGLDFECEYSDLASYEAIRYHTLETPEYFAACLAMEDFASQRSCLFGGFEPGDSVDECR